MRRLDRARAIEFVDASRDATCPADRRALLARFHAREDGRMLVGAAAFAAMWRSIPTLRPLGLAARNRVVLAALAAPPARATRAPAHRPSMAARAGVTVAPKSADCGQESVRPDPRPAVTMPSARHVGIES